ncbi:DeoR/GlpR family DNA-binding transcription regulator [Brachybacterium hainanense]|uniref:Lactose phosphotransferase system repressor n=1 Tax=Brachybacterium hainanense TaxID=1541174 RepID=A0ABV6R7I0_9MICO
MYAQERQRQILAALEESGSVAVTELAERFEVTTETVRRDLDQLASAALLQRVHGGAVPRRTDSVEPDLATRSTTNTPAKARIAAAAARLLPSDPRTALLVDAGTTTAALLPHLAGRRGPLLTNAPAIAQAALSHPDLEVQILPGRLRATTQAAVGSTTVDALRRLHPEVAVLGCNGMTAAGFTTPDVDEAAVKAAMVAAADHRIMLADSSKAGVTQLVTFAAIADVDVLVTDDGLSDPAERSLRDQGIEVVRA